MNGRFGSGAIIGRMLMDIVIVVVAMAAAAVFAMMFWAGSRVH
ncbi:MAG TPA: hypothetical protein VN213_09800 [Solirubrobacteraceae bacterium]|nr:hypothetical protein [Solirubrobacteraceae bacterium]